MEVQRPPFSLKHVRIQSWPHYVLKGYSPESLLHCFGVYSFQSDDWSSESRVGEGYSIAKVRRISVQHCDSSSITGALSSTKWMGKITSLPAMTSAARCRSWWCFFLVESFIWMRRRKRHGEGIRCFFFRTTNFESHLVHCQPVCVQIKSSSAPFCIQTSAVIRPHICGGVSCRRHHLRPLILPVLPKPSSLTVARAVKGRISLGRTVGP